MDLVSAIGVAAAAVQFAEITIKITKRIAIFAVLRDVPEDAEGPKVFVERLSSQLSLLSTTTRRIEKGLVSSNNSFKDNELLDLRSYMSNLNRHGKKLDGLLSKYLPGDGASAPARLLVALKSIAYDTEIKSAVDSINELLPLLTTFLLTSIFANNSLETGPGLAKINFSDIYQVSRYEVQHFIPRPEYQTAIGRIFNNEQTQVPKTAILQGMGGQGKTQLAIRYCAKARAEKKAQCIFWVDASTRASTVRGLEAISESLSDSNHTSLDSDARVALVKLFDNYDNPSAFDLREYIPKGPLGNVLITSRSEGLERLGKVIRISGMTEDEAIQLLFTLLNTPENEANRMAAADVVRRLGRLPLAIDQAGAYMKNEGIALADFLSYYEQSAKDILESVPHLWEYYESTTSEGEQGTTSVAAKTVFTTWNLSFTSLKPDTPEGALNVTVLSLLAFFNEQMISEEFFEAYYSTNKLSQQPGWISLFIDQEGLWSSRKFDSAMRRFLRLSLITSLNTDRVDTKYAFVSLHPLVRDWINLRQERSIYKANFATFSIIFASNILPTFQEESTWEHVFLVFGARRRWLTEHLACWMDVFKQHKSDLRPTVICTEYKRDAKNITAEQLIVKFFHSNHQYDNGYVISQWLWESCDISDRRMMQVKFDAGIQQVRCLYCGHGREAPTKARDKSEKLLYYWESVPLIAYHLRHRMLHESCFVLIKSLNGTWLPEDKDYCVDVCTSELGRLPNNEENMCLRHRMLSELALAAQESSQYNCYEPIPRYSGIRTERRGGMLDSILMTTYSLNDSGLADRLTSVAFEWLKEESEIDVIYTDRTNLLRARVLVLIGKLDKAETITRTCIMTSEKFKSEYYVRFQELLGIILSKQERFEETYAAYNSALFQTQELQLPDETLSLLYDCGELATRFNLELADAHYTLMLSLAKTTNCRKYMGLGFKNLYQVKCICWKIWTSALPSTLSDLLDIDSI
ncbi:hypothetical protein F5Y02DRAFT_406430 [Annulohypoxylon stygium]|nr:hypothetical protein F5Y02DRAFT_406430 [Annulohypoxylon stygium]